MQESTDSLIFDWYREEDVSPKQAFFIFLFFAAVFIIIGLSRKNSKKRVEVIEGHSLWKFQKLVKKEREFFLEKFSGFNFFWEKSNKPKF